MEAPRWRLQEPHYLNVPGTEWDHRETSQTTRKQITKHVKVPLLLDPKEPSDWNYPEEVIVAHAVEGCHNLRADIIFEGSPTMAMEPLNEEARKLSDKVFANCKHPIDSLPGNGFTEDMLTMFTRQLEAVINKAGGIPKGNPSVPNTPLPDDVVTKLQAQMNELMEKNAALERRIAQKEMADADPLEAIEVEDSPKEPAVGTVRAEPSLAEHAQRAANQALGRRM